MLRRATFSPDGIYRYRLFRRWSRGRTILWVMLNPSTADAERDDPTIRRCIAFSRAWGFGAMDVANLYALRATNPGRLRRHPDPVGSCNDSHIRVAASRAAMAIAAWGAFEAAPSRAERVLGLLGGDPQCLGLTRRGHPRHPLYVRADTLPTQLKACATL